MSEAYGGPGNNWTVQAGADLSSHQYKVITVSGTIAANVLSAAGVLQNKPQSGQAATVQIDGVARCLAGGAITAGSPLGVTSGYMVAINSGDGVVSCGRALVAASSGDEFSAMIGMANTMIGAL